MYRFLIGLERGKSGYFAASKTLEEVERNIAEALQMHVRGLRGDNLPIPKAESIATYVTVHFA